MTDTDSNENGSVSEYAVQIQRWELGETGEYRLAERPVRLHGLAKINVLLGKNGSGKSQIMRSLHARLKSTKGRSHYVTPERGGKLESDMNLLIHSRNQVGWVDQQRNANQWSQYKNQTLDLLDELRNNFYRNVHDDPILRKDTTYTFESKILAILNGIIPNVDIIPSKVGFSLSDKNGNAIKVDSISSGESGIISLCVDLINYCIANKDNDVTIFVDEPDAHLHPDLQESLANFIVSISKEYNATFFISTHSTALIYALYNRGDSRVAFMSRNASDLRFRSISTIMESILPIFGAHPLSASFNKVPLLICEGEDDVRIWSRAVRSSNGRISLLPRAAGGAGEIPKFESEAVYIMGAIYDQPIAYSLFDGDQKSVDSGHMEYTGGLTRLYLRCRDAENLLLTDEVLSSCETNWKKLVASFDDWITTNANHRYHGDFVAFKNSGYDRLNGDVKSIRNIILSLLTGNSPWEEIVGAQIAKLSRRSASRTSLAYFLGDDVMSKLVGTSDT